MGVLLVPDGLGGGVLRGFDGLWRGLKRSRKWLLNAILPQVGIYGRIWVGGRP
jgi:hypothetical protein